MNVLVTGVTGYIGSRVTARLVADGHRVRGLSRRPVEVPGVETLVGDAVSGQGLDEALEGIDVTYYLIHSMEPSSDGAFAERDRAAAENFASATRSAGTPRLVYLGGPVPSGTVPSLHLASRLAVEQILLDATPCSLALRASIVIGAGSRSFRFLVRLVERMPVLTLPAWHVHRTSPIDERDILELLVRAGFSQRGCGMALAAAGPESVSYGELIDRIRHHMLVGRPTVAFRRLNLTPIVSRIASLIGSEDYALMGPMMESLEADLLVPENSAVELLGVRLHSLDAAIERALRDWEAREPLAAR
ncbi:MAG TPA: NAD(P)H-binding protein [Solirubrobacteraceae bacterium]|nr:NAD(P)H-binding protein [Solirubrobacteraceae bacterium]